MTTTYDCIATTTLSTSQSSVTFSAINNGFTDLVLMMGGSQSTGTNICMRLNSDTGTNYSDIGLNSYTSVTSNNNSNQPRFFWGPWDSNMAVATFHLQSYANTNVNKTIICRTSSANYFVVAAVGLWRNTNAITTIEVFPDSGSFNSGTVLSLYGIKAE